MKVHRDLRLIALRIRRDPFARIPPPSREQVEAALTRVVEHAQAAFYAKLLGAHLQTRAQA